MGKKRVVIAGMGFGGLHAAKELAGSGVEVIMVDRHNYHLFQPLLYQVATAGLEEESIAYPLRALARSWKDCSFRLGEITGVDFNGKCLKTHDGTIHYDYLILAVGGRTSFFGNESIERYSFDLKQLHQASELRNHILLMFEKASLEADPQRRSALLTFVVVGGGPTGVEFAGALCELIQNVLSLDYPDIGKGESRIVLIEASASILAAMPLNLREYAASRLIEMGIEVRLSTRVVGADIDHVYLQDDKQIDTHTLFWSAGVAAAEVVDTLGLERAAGGRVVINSDLRIEGYPDVFAIGDMSFLQQNGSPLPMNAQVANQQGRHAARNVMALEAGREPQSFFYNDKGLMATIGRSSAVAATHGKTFSGYFAWLAWLLLHLYYLIGFRNRLLVLLNWAYYYLFNEHKVRLISGDMCRISRDCRNSD